MNRNQFYTEDEMLDVVVGLQGSEARDKYESDLHSFLVGEAIRQARESKNLTQQELGALMGVQRAQISKIESGRNLTFATVSRVFRALGIGVKLEIDNLGSVSLC